MYHMLKKANQPLLLEALVDQYGIPDGIALIWHKVQKQRQDKIIQSDELF